MHSTATIQDFSNAALARFEARHRDTDSVLFNTAGFTKQGSKYVVTVRDYIVAEFSTIAEVKAFSAMHNRF